MYSIGMDSDTPVVMARARLLRRVNGMPDVVALRLEALVPPGCGGRTMIVETRLSKREAERLLAAFGRPER